MGKLGTQCSAFGCSKRKKKANISRSDSDGSSDDEFGLKPKLSRIFHSSMLVLVSRLLVSHKTKNAKWIQNMHREDCMATSHSRICSDHFEGNIKLAKSLC